MYDMNDLLPVMAMLTKQYTGIESSSVTYEKANQLMEAVMYCIRELENDKEAQLVSKQQDAMQAYKAGLRLVHRKAEELFALYEQHRKSFCSYGNGYLEDFWNKGLTAFFRYYDETFEPQNTILTLDYPVFADLTGCQGIDSVDIYVRCIVEEQRFLQRFGEDYVQRVLSAYSDDYAELPENMAAIVFGNVIGHLLAGKKLTEKLCEADLQKIHRLYYVSESEEKGRFTAKVNEIAEAFLKQYYADEMYMQAYMQKGLPDLCTRIETAAMYGSLDSVFVY